jgi:hypothetical protein
MEVTVADTVCTETTMTKDRVIMEVAMVRVETIIMINPILSLAAMIIQNIGINRTEVGLTAETVTGMTMTATIITITLTVEVIINGLLITLYPYKTPAFKFSMAILGISHYNTLSSRQYSIRTRDFYCKFSCYSALFRNSIRFSL